GRLSRSLTRLSGISTCHPSAQILIFHQPFLQAPDDTSPLYECGVSPCFLCISCQFYLPSNFGLIVRHECAKMKTACWIVARDIAPARDRYAGHEFWHVQ